MISVQEFRKELGELSVEMTDERVVEIRDSLYAIVESIIDDYIEKTYGTEIQNEGS
ncbi:MAG: hypothetical protein NUV78_02460 [Candidatus Zambryskibacteria bacterium]|nr:hypothetical protein [Candidatus Zambryskibacteria bacterium]